MDRVIAGARSYTARCRSRESSSSASTPAKQYSTELVLSDLEEIELKLVYFLEDHGFPAITVPPVHFDPRRCVDVSRVGRDYEAHLRDAQEEIPERTPEKEARLREMAAGRAAGACGPHSARSARWIDGPGAAGD